MRPSQRIILKFKKCRAVASPDKMHENSQNAQNAQNAQKQDEV